MRPPNRTKIVVTMGPASDNPVLVRKLILAGVNVFRLNFSHGSHKDHARRIRTIRAVSKSVGLPIGILQDLPGPKIRVGSLTGSSLDLKRDERVALSFHGQHSHLKTIPISYPGIVKEVKPFHVVYLADGSVRLIVTRVAGSFLIARVVHGGVIRAGNGVNFPQSQLKLKAFTRADKRHLAFGLKWGVDFVGISFVGEADDIRRVRSFCRRHGTPPLLVAKIERQQALDNLPDITEEADVIMVARGDLGVEIPFSKIPLLQTEIVSCARRYGKPVIVATQVLESMLNSPRPTRAEATDIASAVRDGSDAIMLSGETAVGRYPVEAVRALNSVVVEVENNGLDLNSMRIQRGGNNDLSAVVIGETCHMADRLGVRWLIVPARTGRTAAMVSSLRPRTPVLVLCKNETLHKRFSLFWGIRARMSGRFPSHHHLPLFIRRFLLRTKMAKVGDRVILLSWVPGLSAKETGRVELINVR